MDSGDSIKRELIGKLLFETALLSQVCDANAEEALERQTDSYLERFGRMEHSVAASGKQIKDCDQNMIQHLINDEA